ncbi:hypothetical protein ACLOJK_004226, partial [Asimina triloba]
MATDNKRVSVKRTTAASMPIFGIHPTLTIPDATDYANLHNNYQLIGTNDDDDDNNDNDNNDGIKEKHYNCSRNAHLMVSRGAKAALVMAPAKAPLRNSPTSLLLRKPCTMSTILDDHIVKT